MWASWETRKTGVIRATPKGEEVTTDVCEKNSSVRERPWKYCNALGKVCNGRPTFYPRLPSLCLTHHPEIYGHCPKKVVKFF